MSMTFAVIHEPNLGQVAKERSLETNQMHVVLFGGDQDTFHDSGSIPVPIYLKGTSENYFVLYEHDAIELIHSN